MSLNRVALARGQVDAALVANAARQIAAGGVGVLPTETVYGFCADPRNPASVKRLRTLKGRSAQQQLTHHLAEAQQLQELARSPGARAERLIERYWPGPLTIILPGHQGAAIGARVPAQAFTQAVIKQLGHSLYMSSVNRSGEPPLLLPDEIAAAFGKQIDLFVTRGPPQLRTASTVVDATTPEFRVVREGILSREDVLSTAARTVLFVCSGNTCRSPMAEVLARAAASKALQVPPDRLLARGLRFRSAGTATIAGLPASEHSITGAREVGLDLLGHRSQPVTRDLAREAAVILCMSHGHRQRLLDLDPSLEGKTWLLDPGGEDVDDPFGAEPAQYRTTRDQIAGLIDQRLPDLLKLVDA